MGKTSFFAVVLIAAFAVPVFAQAPPAAPPTRIRGTVVTFEGHTLTVKSPDGKFSAVTLAPDFTVRGVVAETLDDIKAGEKVGIISVKESDGTLQAIEVTIFPASLTTVRTAEFPWDLRPGSLMTNAPVAEVASAPRGRSIKVSLNGKEEEITVPPDIPIVTYAPGAPALLKPGAAVFVFARKQPNGSLTAASVTAEENGVKPPM